MNFMKPFKAFRIQVSDGKVSAGIESITLNDLSPGDVLIKSVYSSINYKDALAATGSGQVLKKPCLVGGIDVAGYVETSSSPRFHRGDQVLVCGAGFSETCDGGFSEFVRVPAEKVIAVPEGLSLFEVMAMGTAGFTAALAVHQLQLNGQRPEWGAILVTGASGGVGSYAIDILSALGYQVVASTSRLQNTAYLESLGASKVLSSDTLSIGNAPLEKGLWGGAVDSVGGELLCGLTRTVKPMGNIAVIGLAGGIKLETTVLPFILRGINLLGINSVSCAHELKVTIWQRLATDFRPTHIDKIVTAEITMNQLADSFDAYIQGRHSGRTVLRIAD